MSETVELATAAEAAGFSDIWLPDHYFLRDTFVAQALMAERTEHIRFGTAVVSPLLRHPALLASSTATVNELSNGRAIIGIGPGGFEFHRNLGLPPDQPLEVVRDAVNIVRALFEGETTYRGKRFNIADSSLGWSAGQIPVYMAARGPRMLELAGEIADGVITHGLAPSYVSFALERMAVGAARSGRSASTCEACMMFAVELDEDEERALNRLRPRCTVMAGGEYAEELIPLYGLDSERVTSLRAAVRLGDLGAAEKLVTDEMVDAFGCAGPVAKLVTLLRRLENNGVTRTILNIGSGASLEDAVDRITCAGEAVAQVA